MMKKLYFISFLFMFILFSSMSVKTEAKTTNIKVNKTYKVNIDGKKGKEKIKITKKAGKEEGDYLAYKLYINGKKVKTIYGWEVICKVIDIDKKDNAKEIVFYTTAENGGTANFKIYRYKNKKLKNIIKVPAIESYFRLNSIKTNGKGKLTFVSDTPVYFEQVGCYYTKRTYLLKNSKLREDKADGSVIKFDKDSAKNVYKLRKSVSVYSSTDGKTVVKTLTKGTKLKVERIYFETGKNEFGYPTVAKAYARILVDNKYVGWINLPDTTVDGEWSEDNFIFDETTIPTWG